jgi:DNA-binding transcriptional regulator/RsmH inhibitor MraZ
MELGEESELDGQGRVSLSTDLRRELKLTDQPVKIVARSGVVDVLSEAMFASMLGDAKTLDQDALTRLRMAGLK